jgi:hypothetical protein
VQVTIQYPNTPKPASGLYIMQKVIHLENAIHSTIVQNIYIRDDGIMFTRSI